MNKLTSRKFWFAVAGCAYFVAISQPDKVFWIVTAYLGSNAISHLGSSPTN